MDVLNHLCVARLPQSALPALATLRCRGSLQAIVEGDHVWLRWPAGDADVLRLVLPIPGVELYGQHDGEWRRQGQRLPAAAPPTEPVQRLDQLIVPEKAAVEPAPTPDYPRVKLSLVRAGQARPTTGLLASVEALHAWAVNATSRQLAGLKAARRGRQVLLLGTTLPPLSAGVRLWGQRLLVPLGYRPKPDLPDSALADAIGLREGEIALFINARDAASAKPPSADADAWRIEIIPDDALYALTRAAVRLAFAEGRP